MPEMNDSELRGMFKAAGHTVPDHDLSSRIMARVSVTRLAAPTLVTPLISKRGWIAIGSLFAVLAAGVAAFCGTTAASPLAELAAHLPNGFHVPEGPWPQWAIGASLLALFFVLVAKHAEQKSAA